MTLDKHLTNHTQTQATKPLALTYALYAAMFLASGLIAYFALDSVMFAPWPKHWAMCVALGIIGATAVLLLDRLSERLFKVARELNQRFSQILGHLEPKACFYIAMSSSLAEEALFRGVLLPVLGFVPSSLLFGLLHWGGRDKVMWLWTILAIAMGFAFGAMTLWSGNIVAACIAHFSINYINLRRISAHTSKAAA